MRRRLVPAHRRAVPRRRDARRPLDPGHCSRSRGRRAARGGHGNAPVTALIDDIHRVFLTRRQIDLDTNFFEAGFSSSNLAEIVVDLCGQGLPVSLLELYRHPTVRQLARALGAPAGAVPPWLA
ncbi:MAG: acyl carrier protein [Actinobacteria bacterium]|nr:MAG: acyl carrier protein [Actinomycetota bacterium]